MKRTNDKPVTRRELVVELRQFKESISEEVGDLKLEMNEKMQSMKEEILHHFDAVAENIITTLPAQTATKSH